MISKFVAVECLLWWVNTCNITAYRNTVTLQVTNTIQSSELNFHPVDHGLTVSWKRYTLGFPVCYGSPSDVLATSSRFVHLYILRFKEKEKPVGKRTLGRHRLRLKYII